MPPDIAYLPSDSLWAQLADLLLAVRKRSRLKSRHSTGEAIKYLRVYEYNRQAYTRIPIRLCMDYIYIISFADN